MAAAILALILVYRSPQHSRACIIGSVRLYLCFGDERIMAKKSQEVIDFLSAITITELNACVRNE